MNSSRSHTELARASQQIENGRFAIQTLQEDIWHAGYYGRHVAYTTSAPTALPDPARRTSTPARQARHRCKTRSSFRCRATTTRGAYRLRLRACRQATSLPGTTSSCCGVRTRAPRRLAALAANTFYLQSVAEAYHPTTLASLKPIIAKGNPSTAFTQFSPTTGELGEIRRYHVHIYFVAPCSAPAGGGTSCTGASDDGGRPIPTLKRLELAPTAPSRSFRSSRASSDSRSSTASIPRSPACPSARRTPETACRTATSPRRPPPSSPRSSPRVYLVARANEPSTGYVDTKTYDLGLHGTYEPNLVAEDRPYKRHLFTSLVRLQNAAGWREK